MGGRKVEKSEFWENIFNVGFKTQDLARIDIWNHSEIKFWVCWKVQNLILMKYDPFHDNFYFFDISLKYTYQQIHYYHVSGLRNPYFCDFWPIRTYIKPQEAIFEKDSFLKILNVWLFKALGLRCLWRRSQALFPPIFLGVCFFSFSEALTTNSFIKKDCLKWGPVGLRAAHDLKRQKLVCAISKRPSAN